ncbi:MAG TPA: hypothetical protein VGZ25_10165, partial [Gemmataceae bacterium]|nr:hypothetical protein [Gemmataceae bacterium]
GPGTVHEVAVASGRGALVIPVGRSGGHAKVVYGQMTCPQVTDEQTWTVLGSAKSTPEETAKAVCRIVELFTSSVRL